MNSRGGFTLIEVLVALAVVGLVATAVLAQAGAAIHAQADASESMIAATLAEQKLEALRALASSDLERLPDTLRSGRFAPPLEAYGWAARAERSRHEPALLDVEVEIEWQGGRLPVRARWYRP